MTILIVHGAHAMKQSNNQEVVEAVCDAIREKREITGYHPRNLPALFDEEENGVVVDFKKKEKNSDNDRVVTDFGGMYEYDEANKNWTLMNGGQVTIRTNQDLINRFKDSADIRSDAKAYINELDTEGIYNAKAQVLVRYDKDMLTLIAPHKTHDIRAEYRNYNRYYDCCIKKVLFSEDGSICAYTFNAAQPSISKHCGHFQVFLTIAPTAPMMLENTNDMPLNLNQKTKALTTFFPPSFENKDIAQLSFDNNNNLHIKTLDSRREDRISYNICPFPSYRREEIYPLFDVGIKDEEWIPLNPMYRFPVLHNRFANAFVITREVPKVGALIQFVYWHIYQNETPRDVINNILFFYRDLDELFQKGLSYGVMHYKMPSPQDIVSSPSELSDSEKKACKILSEVTQQRQLKEDNCNRCSSEEYESYVSKKLNAKKWNGEDVWHAIKYAHEWEEMGSEKDTVGYHLWNSFYKTIDKEQQWDERRLDKLTVSVEGQVITIREVGNYDSRRLLRESFYEHKNILTQAEKYPDFIDQCKVQHVQETLNGVLVKLHNGYVLSAEKKNNGWVDGKNIQPEDEPIPYQEEEKLAAADSANKAGTCVIS